ncbi:MAG TPA: hypothetical protein VHA12_02220 [Candidatus Nanoarchaeia archaeon]|nr:hypothetical protein [Candidatus Nanoarchaeia archaeon]
MGGKRLKFPKRGKYVAPTEEIEVKKEEVSKEEHEARLQMLKDMGLVK